MKINFIRQISDEILKQNHELKTTIIIIKQQLQNYEDKMLTFIRQRQVDTPIYSTPEQTLNTFIKFINSQLYDYKSQIIKNQISSKKIIEVMQQLKKNETTQRQLRQEQEAKETKWRQQLQVAKKDYFELERKSNKFLGKEQDFKKEILSITEKHKIQTNMLEQYKKKQVQNVKLYYHNHFMQLRDQIQRQNLQLQKKMQTQISEKDKRVKQLQKLLQKLTVNMKLNNSQASTLTHLLQAFQQSHKSRRTIQELKDQNTNLRKNLSELEKVKMGLQSTIIQSKIKEHNLQSDIERQKLQKIQFQNKLASKIKQVEESQRDKQEMEQYYDRKWNSEYSKVRSHVEKAFTQKSEALQKAYVQRMQEFQSKIIQWSNKIAIYQLKNKELQKIHQEDIRGKQILRNTITQIKSKYQQLRYQNTEMWKMSRQQICMFRLMKEQRQQILNQQIYNLKKQLQIKQSKIQIQSQKLQIKITQLVQESKEKMVKQIKDLSTSFQKQKQNIKKNYEYKIQEMNQDFQIQKKQIQNTKKVIKQECKAEILVIQSNIQKTIKQRQQQSLRKIQKLSHKIKDYQLKISNSKKTHDESQLQFQKQRVGFEREIQSQKVKIFNLQQQVKKGITDKKQMIAVTDLLQQRIDSFQQIINLKNKELEEVAHKYKIASLRSECLTAQRAQWQAQLHKLSKQYKQQFQNLKKLSDRQINLYRSKLWELQELSRKHVITKKNYQKLQQLNSEKEDLKTALDIKQAENIVLSQVKDFYESQLRLTQSKTSNLYQNKLGKFILSRKIDRHRRPINKTFGMSEQRQMSQLQTKQVAQMRKYILHSQKKQTLTLSKTRYREVLDFQRNKTNPV